MEVIVDYGWVLLVLLVALVIWTYHGLQIKVSFEFKEFAHYPELKR